MLALKDQRKEEKHQGRARMNESASKDTDQHTMEKLSKVESEEKRKDGRND